MFSSLCCPKASAKEEVRQWKALFDDVVEKLASAKSAGELVAVVGVVALTPAVCEEVVFRGLIQA